MARANDTPYDIATVVEEKCFGDGYEGPPRVRVFGDFEGVAVTCGKYLRILAVDPARRGRGIGTALLRDANIIVIAAEPGNYFTPGVPEHVAGFFKRLGYFETARTQNLVCTSGGDAVLPAGDRERVFAFIEKNFGPIWRFEAAKGEKILHVEDRGDIVGFSTHDANNHGLGWFGPTGVAESHRGRGLGRLLLLASLADLRRLGYHRVVIPWTDAIEFYRKTCGAQIESRFVILRKEGA
ncbi:MAG TPA: GNAT family N-acetyltransferase [Rhodanobacteraceae bacterium]